MDYGWTFVVANAHSFDTGMPWRLLYNAGATVFVGGRGLVTFAGPVDDPDGGAKGIILAPKNEAGALTCDQPYVSNTTPPLVHPGGFGL